MTTYDSISRMKRTITLILTLLMLCACEGKRQNYVIGVSQCSEDSWRKKLKEELEIATYFNPNVELIYTYANDDSKQQERQIDSLISRGVDLLIVSPNQVELLSDKIERAYDSGIPVILFDRKTNSSKYTAFMGTDNYRIGEMMGHYLAGVLGHKGKVAEIGGLQGSSPAAERHSGFTDAISSYPEMQIVGFASGDWTQDSGYRAMNKILSSYKGGIDAVFGGNDRMAIGARRALRESGRDKGEVIYLGVDALPYKDGGISQVADSLLYASAIYPTHGDELMLLSLDILEGREYQRENIMKSSI
ncbi:MAG: substrate-binding domain-containing protein, partial [Candidatus Cryptobacteroides sp.]